MVPNIAGNGKSFRGAGAYHLHDKAHDLYDRPTSSNRVPWTATRNLVNDDPEKAIDEMWHTAEAAAHLKKMSGHDQRGRKCDDPVKTISLSWAPHQSPTRQEMEAAADGFLRHMGWQQHQALLLPHTDTAHPHLHIILNRVHPETGLVLNDWREHQRSQRWADQHDRDQGLILCHARAEKYENGRFDLQPDGTPYPFAKLGHEQERAFENPLAEATVQDQTEKNLLAERHRQEREEFLQSGKRPFRQARQAAYREVREEFRPLWREHFKQAKDTRDRLEDEKHLVHREAVRLARAGDHAGAAECLAKFDDERKTAYETVATDRIELRQQQLDTTRERQDEACRGLIEQRAQDFQQIKNRQKDERTEFKELLALREAGHPFDVDRLQQLLGQDAPPAAANDNRVPDELIELARETGQDRPTPEQPMNPFTQQAYELFGRSGYSDTGTKGSSRDLTDVGSAAIGAAIEFAARMLDSIISPPSPRDQAIAKAWAAREAVEMPKRIEEQQEVKLRHDFTRHALTAVREAQAEQDRERKLDHEERGRSRERER